MVAMLAAGCWALCMAAVRSIPQQVWPSFGLSCLLPITGPSSHVSISTMHMQVWML